MVSSAKVHVLVMEKNITGAASMEGPARTGGTIALQIPKQQSTMISARILAKPGRRATTGVTQPAAGIIAHQNYLVRLRNITVPHGSGCCFG